MNHTTFLSPRLFPLLEGMCQLTPGGHYCALQITAVADTRLTSDQIVGYFHVLAGILVVCQSTNQSSVGVVLKESQWRLIKEISYMSNNSSPGYQPLH